MLLASYHNDEDAYKITSQCTEVIQVWKYIKILYMHVATKAFPGIDNFLQSQGCQVWETQMRVILSSAPPLNAKYRE